MLRQMVLEIGRVGAPVCRAQAFEFGGITGRIGQWTRLLRLAAEGMHLDEIEFRDRFADARLAQPRLPRLKNSGDLLVGIHRRRVAQAEIARRRFAAREPRQIDPEVAIGKRLGHDE